MSEAPVQVTYQVHTARRRDAVVIEEGPRPQPLGQVPRVARLLALAHHFQELLDEGVVRSQRALAALAGITPPRVTQLTRPIVADPRLFSRKIADMITHGCSGACPMSEPWVSGDEIARHLGVAKDTVYRWIETRGLPANRMGRLWKKVSKVNAWVERGGAGDEQRHGGPSTKSGRR